MTVTHDPQNRGATIGVLSFARFMMRNRHLIADMTSRDIATRFSGRLFGAVWAIASPFALMAIYVAVFTFLYNVRLADVGDFRGDYTALLLSGLVPWIVIQEVVARASASLLSEPGLVRQIAFPSAVLPIRTVLAGWPMAASTTVFLLAYQAFAGPPPPLTALLLPLYWCMLALFLIGLGLLLSALAVFFRDVSEILSLVFSAGLFLSPILFIPGLTPGWLERVFYFNPFSYPIWVHKDLVFYGHIEHPIAWIGFPVLTVAFFVLGASLFRSVEGRFGEAL